MRKVTRSSLKALQTTLPFGNSSNRDSSLNYSTTLKKPAPLTNNNNNKTMKNLFAVKYYSTSTLLADKNTTPTLDPTPPTTTLDPTLFKKWTKEEVCSILCTDEGEGGAGLTVEKVKPLYDAGFDGSVLGNIVNINNDGEEKALSRSKTALKDGGIAITPELSSTLESVVNWVNNQLMPKLYHLWSADQVKEQLCKPIGQGGAGLSEDHVKPFRDYGFGGNQVVQVYRKVITIEQLLKNFKESGITMSSQLETTCESVVRWIMKTLHTMDQLTVTPQTFKKFPRYVPTVIIDHETKMDVDRKHLAASSTTLTKFNEEELFLLEELSGMHLLPLDTSKNADSFIFDLKNREKTIEKVVNGIKQYNNRCKNENRKMTKQDIPFLIADGGRGSGKSRILVELGNILRTSQIADEYKRTRVIYFNFTNGFNIDIRSTRDQNYVSMITARIVDSAFDEGKSWGDKLPSISNNDFLYEVFAIISKKLHEKYNVGMEVAIPILLIVDEFQHATRSIPSLGTTIQHLLSWYMRQFQKQHGLIIIPALGGTLTEGDITFDATDHAKGKIQLNLPCLRENDTKSIVCGYPELKAYYTDRSKFIWDIIGYVPRHLEWAIQYALDLVSSGKEMNVETFMSQVYIHTAQSVLGLYGNVDSKELHYLVLVYLSGMSQHVEYFSDTLSFTKTKMVENFKQKGLLYEKNGGKLQLPLIVLDQVIPESNEFPKNMIQDFITMSNKPEWEKLEELCLKTLACRFSLFFSAKNTNLVRFQYLFNGTIYPSKLKNVMVTASIGTSFLYQELDKPLFESDCDDSIFKKTNKGEKGVDGLGCKMKLTFANAEPHAAVLVTQAKLQEESSKDVTYGPADIAEFYGKALKFTFKDTEKYLLIVTNKKISQETKEMIEKGVLKYTENKSEKVLQCPNLIMISRDCFSDFFSPFIADFLTTFSIQN